MYVLVPYYSRVSIEICFYKTRTLQSLLSSFSELPTWRKRSPIFVRVRLGGKYKVLRIFFKVLDSIKFITLMNVVYTSYTTQQKCVYVGVCGGGGSSHLFRVKSIPLFDTKWVPPPAGVGHRRQRGSHESFVSLRPPPTAAVLVLFAFEKENKGERIFSSEYTCTREYETVSHSRSTSNFVQYFELRAVLRSISPSRY